MDGGRENCLTQTALAALVATFSQATSLPFWTETRYSTETRGSGSDWYNEVIIEMV